MAPVDPFTLDEVMRERLQAQGHALKCVNNRFVDAGASAHTAWDIFKEMAVIPVAERVVDEDGEAACINVDEGCDWVTFESAATVRLLSVGSRHIDDPHRPEVSALDFWRKFSFTDDDGEYVGMHGLELTIEFPLHPRYRAFDSVSLAGTTHPRPGIWPEKGLREWISEVEASEPFVELFRGSAPERCLISFEAAF